MTCNFDVNKVEINVTSSFIVLVSLIDNVPLISEAKTKNSVKWKKKKETKRRRRRKKVL